MFRTGGFAIALAAASFLMLQTDDAVAAAITWSSAQTISGDSDVSTAGSLVGALNIGAAGVGNTTVNGVNFQGLAVSGTSVTSGMFTFNLATGFGAVNGTTSGNPPFANLSPAYQSLLSSYAGNLQAAPFTLTISGLNIGDQYLFEWWVNATNRAYTHVSATATNSVTLANNDASSSDGGVGQFASGTFTADSSVEVITFDAASPITYASQPVVDGLQLRNLSTEITSAPEPSTLALASAGLIGLGAMRRRKKKVR